MNYTKIGLDEKADWEEVLNNTEHSFAHHLDYCQAMSITSGLPTNLHVFEESGRKAFIVLSEREKEKGKIDFVSPYGFGGFAGDREFLASGIVRNVFMELGKSSGIITAYILQNPLKKLDEICWKNEIHCGHTFYKMDLSKDLTAIWKTMGKVHRYEINKTQRESSTNFLTEKSMLSSPFKKLYKETIKRVGASDIYNFHSETLDILLHSSNALLIGVEDNAGVQAASLFLYNDFAAEYFLSAATIQGRKYSRQIIWKAIKMLKKLNISQLNLGGGIRTGDSLDDFKRRFGGKAIKGQALKIIFCEDEFNKLNRRYCNSNLSENRYFPPYWASTK